ncbi:hypothetical protein HKX48_003404 [Thoreauomyces humboldtii]|nr:hypothetical protein HKX48_003404 [Thoreauomyces humboldtii]
MLKLQLVRLKLPYARNQPLLVLLPTCRPFASSAIQLLMAPTTEYPRQPPPDIKAPPQWIDISASGAATGSDAAAGSAEPIAPPSDLVEKILLFPTYGRMSLSPQQAAEAALIGKAAAKVPSTPPSVTPRRSGSYFSSKVGRPLSGSWLNRGPAGAPPSQLTAEPASITESIPSSGAVTPVPSRPASPRISPRISPASKRRSAHLSREAPLPPPRPVEDASNGDEKHWVVNVKGWIYGTRAQSRKRKVLLALSRRFLAPAAVDAAAESRHDARAGLFLATSMRGVQVRIAVAGLAPSDHAIHLRRTEREKRAAAAPPLASLIVDDEEEDELGDVDWERLKTVEEGVTLTTDASGFFAGTVKVPLTLVDKWKGQADPLMDDPNAVRLVAFKMEDNELHSVSTVNLISPDGVSVISDVDDTIKDSSVHVGKMAAINAALFAEAREVPGMADAYNYLVSKKCAIHYVSAGPYQLYPMLSAFLRTSRFPPGSLNLRNVWEKENMSSRAYKHKVITRILQDFPDRRFILVGDSGEADIETFAGLHAVASDRIIKLFIRDVNSHKLPFPKTRSFPLRSRDSASSTDSDRSLVPDPFVNPLVARARDVYSAMERDRWCLFKLPEDIFTDAIVVDAVNKALEGKGEEGKQGRNLLSEVVSHSAPPEMAAVEEAVAANVPITEAAVCPPPPPPRAPVESEPS